MGGTPMGSATSARLTRPPIWLLSTMLLLSVLLLGYTLPARPDRIGPGLLTAKLQWSGSWLSLHWLGLLPQPSAETLVRLDPELVTQQGQEAARWLAQSASDQQER